MQTVRTFVAVETSTEVREAISRLVARLEDRGQTKSSGTKSSEKHSTKIKWVERENLHFTLNFLGDVPADQVPEVCQTVERAAARHAPFAIEIGGAGAFPTPQRPRTAWVGVTAGSQPMQLLQADLEGELKKLGFRPEGRDYTPHLTIGRVRFLARGDDLPQRLNQERDFAAGAMDVAEVVVFSSELGPKGSIYTPLTRARLGP
jgi:2'-5' RNA ligase